MTTTASDWIPLVSPPHVGDSRLDLAIAWARKKVGVRFDASDQKEEAVALLACHRLVLSDRAADAGKDGSAGTGSITSDAYGGQTTGYAAPGGLSAEEAAFAATPHGLAYLGLRDGLSEPAIFLARCDLV